MAHFRAGKSVAAQTIGSNTGTSATLATHRAPAEPCRIGTAAMAGE
ncbi:hypothetical protein I553_0348 [Mycobacterium xenopi 4042]|uniref:Uncharacterized protein n=1 Tax=Mycobacterium xenopi 4042 TaxID=1299334 RepID=X7YLX2_MYCXE|nr:hypothetical protein I553_0348 [Mycobacterium xenopi 4042]